MIMAAARLCIVFCLAALACASAATVFSVSGALSNGASFSGTLTINTVTGIVTAANVTIGPPSNLTCVLDSLQFAVPPDDYELLLTCSPGNVPFNLFLDTTIAAGGHLSGYTGGEIDPIISFLDATAIVTAGRVGLLPDGPFQVRYAANLNAGESYIDIVNDGANGAALLGPGFGSAAGNICVNVYAFSPDEQLISCCSCLVTPDGLVHLGVNADLTSKTLTGVIPTSVVVKLLTTLAGTGGAGTSCTNSAATATVPGLAIGTVAWGTTLHPQGATNITTETSFTPANLTTDELASITGRCGAILGNGSGFGICNSCKAGGLGAAQK
jgi:hypothetical protein